MLLNIIIYQISLLVTYPPPFIQVRSFQHSLWFKYMYCFSFNLQTGIASLLNTSTFMFQKHLLMVYISPHKVLLSQFFIFFIHPFTQIEMETSLKSVSLHFHTNPINKLLFLPSKYISYIPLPLQVYCHNLSSSYQHHLFP